MGFTSMSFFDLGSFGYSQRQKEFKIKERQFNDLKIKVRHQSADEILEKHKDIESMDRKERKELLDSYRSYSHYQLCMENAGGSGMLKKMAADPSEYQTLIQYLSFDLSKDLFLCTSQDTLKCSFTHFERNFDLAPYIRVDVGFFEKDLENKLCAEESWSLQFNADHFGIGPVKFAFDSEKLCKN